MGERTKKGNALYYVNCAIGLFLMFGFGRIVSPIGTISEVGMQVLGVFLGMIWLWSMADIIWPSILGIVAMGLTDYCSMNDAIGSALGQPTVWQLFMVMILLGAVNASGAGAAMGNWILSRKFTKGRPVFFVWFFCVGFMTLSIFLSGSAILLLSWGVLYTILQQSGYKVGEKFYTLFVIADFLSVSFGSTVLPFRGIKMALLNSFSNAIGGEIDYFGYMAVTYTTGIVATTVFVLCMKYLFKADFSKIKDFDSNTVINQDEKITKEAKILLFSFALMIVYILLTSMLKIDGAFWAWFSKIGSYSIFAVGVGVLSMIKVDGKPVIEFKKFAQKLEWNAIFISAGAIQVASAISSKDCGIVAYLGDLMTPILGGASGFLFVFAAIVLSIALTNVANNIAVGMLMIPLILSMAGPMGLNINLIGMLVVFCVQCAWLLPGSSLPAALLHGNEHVVTKDVYKYGAFAAVMLIVILGFVIYPVFELFL